MKNNVYKSKIIKKMSGESGETLVETLAAMMVAVMGITMLSGAIVASGKIIGNNRSEKYYENHLKLSSASEKGLSDKSIEINFSNSPEGLSTKDIVYGQSKNVSEGSVEVNYYLNEKKDAALYEKEK